MPDVIDTKKIIIRCGKRRSEMLKKIVLVLLLITICISCCACQFVPKVNEPVEFELFSTVKVYEEGKVIVDNQTGVMYWLSYRGNLTLLVDETGNPKIFEGR